MFHAGALLSALPLCFADGGRALRKKPMYFDSGCELRLSEALAWGKLKHLHF